MKRICLVLLLSAFVFFSVSGAFSGNVYALESGFSNFKFTRDYNQSFQDVRAGDWFYDSVVTAYKLNLIQGTGPNSFHPDGNVSIAETIAVAARIHSLFHTGSADFKIQPGKPWYTAYVEYASANGISKTEFLDYTRPATRSEFVGMIAHSMPDHAFSAIGDVDDGAIPDVPMTRSYSSDVYKLYRAGVISGSDKAGTFKPDSNITRKEAVAVLTRLADPTRRREITLKKLSEGPSSAVSIAQKCASSVFYIEMYDEWGSVIGNGSGFFINSDGTAVTNYHVISDIASAKIKLPDGAVYNVKGVYDYNIGQDIALIQIDGEGFDFLPIGDSRSIVAGQTVFAIGSPDGLDNTISQGIVSNISRYVDGTNYIQFTAPISSGSSGGALIDESGAVIGITSASVTGQSTKVLQNLNLAVPIHLVYDLSKGKVFAFSNSDSAVSQDGAIIYIDETYLIMSPGEYRELIVFESTGDENMTLRYDIRNEYIAEADWGDWFDEHTTSLTITATDLGETEVEIQLLDSEKNIICVNTVTVLVTYAYSDFELSADPPVLVVEKGREAVVNIRQESGFPLVYLTYTVSGGNVESRWADEWDDNHSIDLYITGVSSGKDIVIVRLYDEYDNFLKSMQIHVLVN